MPEEFERLLRHTLITCRNGLNGHFIVSVAMVAMPIWEVIRLFSEGGWPNAFNIGVAVVAFVCWKATRPLKAIFDGPLIDLMLYDVFPRAISVKAFYQWEVASALPGAFAAGPSRREINAYHYTELKDYLATLSTPEVQVQAASIMEKTGKITYKDLVALLLYAEGLEKWNRTQLEAERAREVKEALIGRRGFSSAERVLPDREDADQMRLRQDVELQAGSGRNIRKGFRKVEIDVSEKAPDA